MVEIIFDFEELEKFIDSYCNSDENISSKIFLSIDGIYETTHFNIQGKKWVETKRLISRKQKR